MWSVSNGIYMKCSFNLHYWQPEVKGPSLCSGGGGWGAPGMGSGGWEGSVRFYKSQCKSRDKYYLLFEERHSRYLLYRGESPVRLEHKFGLFQRKPCGVKRLDDYSALSMSEHSLTWPRTSTRKRRQRTKHNKRYLKGPGVALVAFFSFLFFVRVASLALLFLLCSNGWALHCRQMTLTHDGTAKRGEMFASLGFSEWRQFVQLTWENRGSMWTWHEESPRSVFDLSHFTAVTLQLQGITLLLGFKKNSTKITTILGLEKINHCLSYT